MLVGVEGCDVFRIVEIYNRFADSESWPILTCDVLRYSSSTVATSLECTALSEIIWMLHVDIKVLCIVLWLPCLYYTVPFSVKCVAALHGIVILVAYKY